MKIKDLILKIKRKWMKIRLLPIRAFCLHHVSAEYDAESMNRGDWMQIEEFKSKINAMRQSGIKFILLTEALRHISKDWIRCTQYAVLTFDDGYASLKEILPWLNEQRIPVTLFINGKYLDGKSYRKNPKEKYLIAGELFALTSPLIEIGSHGWEHTSAIDMNMDEFKHSIEVNFKLLRTHPRHIPFHAYTWGRHTSNTDAYLLSRGITPVYIDGMKNYKNHDVIHRELLGNM